MPGFESCDFNLHTRTFSISVKLFEIFFDDTPDRLAKLKEDLRAPSL